MYKLIDGIPVWGEHDEATLQQIARCAADEQVAGAALMADGHKGYSMPIGGVVAYRDAVSPSAVGFDISCLAAGTLVTTANGYTLPIEQVAADEAISCWDGTEVRQVVPHFGMIRRGLRETVLLRLGNGRALQLTPDHCVMTDEGWKTVATLSHRDVLACPIFIGLPYEAASGEVELVLRNPALAEDLRRRGLFPLVAESPLFPALVRLLGVVSGDGHLTKNGKRISIYTTSEQDALSIAADLSALGCFPSIARRQRRADIKPEHNVYVDSVALHALFEALGSPVGKKVWPEQPMTWIFDQPAWLRAQFLSAFCSAEMMTPRTLRNHLPNLQLKQADFNVIAFINRLCSSLGFPASVAPSGPARGDRQDYVLQLLGAGAAQVRFMEQVGFCYAAEKRARGAEAASVFWQHQAPVERRERAKLEVRYLYAEGFPRREIIANIQRRYDVANGFVQDALYEQRGKPRIAATHCKPATSGEIAWVPVASIEEAGEAPVFDIVTQDSAESFLAAGVVVHNCGNKAARTNLRGEDVRPQVKAIMDQIARTVVFGIGRTSGKAVDHELFDDPAWRDQRELGQLRDQARQQLGTVGSGNHYVDLFEDEQGWIWVGVHFGSRGLGHRTASGFLNLAAGRSFDDKAPGESMDQPATVIPLSGELGQAYWQAMQLASRYAYAGRDFVVGQVLEILGAQAVDEVHNNHNLAWRETHNGEELIVVRKGATPAFPGQRGFIGGSMGDISVIIEGIESDEARTALYSTVHGAGRVMSRTKAAGKRRWVKRGDRRVSEIVAPGLISREMMHEWLRREGVELRGAGTDESPHVYRRLPEVLHTHAGSIRILHTLRPLGVAMAGEDEFDPYKD